MAGGFRCPVCTLEELRKARESTAEDYGECAECERPLTAEDTEFCEACDRADYEASQAARAAKDHPNHGLTFAEYRALLRRQLYGPHA